jgi:hypothetical protein
MPAAQNRSIACAELDVTPWKSHRLVSALIGWVCKVLSRDLVLVPRSSFCQRGGHREDLNPMDFITAHDCYHCHSVYDD